MSTMTVDESEIVSVNMSLSENGSRAYYFYVCLNGTLLICLGWMKVDAVLIIF